MGMDMTEVVVALLMLVNNEIKESRHNAVNIDRLQKDVDKILEAIDLLKDKVRSNGNTHD